MAKAATPVKPAAPAKAAPTKSAPAKAAAPAARKPGNAVQKTTPQSSAVGMPAEMSDLFLQHAGAGLEKATAADFALPFIYLLQKMSPQVDPDSEKFIDGAKVGQFLNTVTGQIYDRLVVVPVDFEKVYIEWVPRDAGGGFVAQYRSKNDAEMNKREDTQIVDTANHYVLVNEEDGSWTPAILSMTSTKLKASRKWLSVISMVTINTAQGKRVAPSFSRMYEVIKEGPITNDKGTFYTIKVNAFEGEEGWVKDPELFDQALSFRAQLQAGAVGADYNKAGDTVVDDADVVDDGAPM